MAIFLNTISNIGQHIAVDVFDKNFQILEANSAELLDHAFRLRYRIFIEERKFDLPSNRGRERDKYDDRSLNFLVHHKPTGEFIGTGRLIYTTSNPPTADLPIQEYLSRDGLLLANLQHPQGRRETCEISRLGILNKYCKKTSSLYRHYRGLYTPFLSQHLANLGKLALYRAIFQFALTRLRTPNCVFTTDPFLLNRFDRLGFKKYTVLGPNIDIFGPVSPVHFNIHTMLNHACTESPLPWAVVTNNGKIFEA